MTKLSHINEKGEANMVDVASKPDQIRIAHAEGFIHLMPKTIEQVNQNNLKKGDVLATARIAAIMGAKQTSNLIPLCHPLALTKVEVDFEIQQNGIKVETMSKCIGKTGVEMEALTAVNVALLTIYDMCKAVDKQMVMTNVRLISKTKQ